MGARQKAWARTARIRLTLALGGRCSACRDTHHLTFDLRMPRHDGHHKLSTDQRMTFYRAEARRGNVQLLCSTCNVMKGHCQPIFWIGALQWAAESETILRLSLAPGQGNAVTPADRREWIKAALLRSLAELLECKLRAEVTQAMQI